MKNHTRHKRTLIPVISSLFIVSIIVGISLVLTGQLAIPSFTQIASINMIREDGKTEKSTTTKKAPKVTKPTTTTKTTTRTEKDEDINGKGMNTKITTTVNTAVDTAGNKTTSTAIVSTPVNNKGTPTSPVDTKTTIVKKETADGSTPTITAVTEKVSKEKTDDGFITRTQTTTTDVPTQESTTQYTTSENFTTKEKTDEGFITNKTTITRDDVTGDIVADKTNTTSTIKNTTSSVEKTDDGFIRTNTTITRDANTGEIIDAFSVTSTPTPRPVATPKPTEKPTSFWDTVSDKLNNSDELSGLGTNGLGGGNAPVVTPPMSVITSDNPQDLADFYKGVGYSMGAGAVAAGTTLTTGLLAAPVVGQTIAAYGAATLATSPVLSGVLSYGGAALTIGSTAAGAYDCSRTGGTGSLCNTVREGLFTGYMTDPVGTTELYAQSTKTLITNPINRLLKSADNYFFSGLNLDGFVPLDQTSTALVGDLHADLPTTKKLFKDLGIIDEYGPTGRPFVAIGDYFGKNTSLQTSTTPGLDVFEYVQNIQNTVGTERAIIQAGNWEPRTAKAVVAYLTGNEEVLNALIKKNLSLAEIENLASNPEQFAAMLKKLDYVSIVDGQLLQHIDTPELARLSFSSADLAKLAKTNPTLAQEANILLDTTKASGNLTVEQLKALRKAQVALGLSPSQITQNINQNAQNITTNALLDPSNELASAALDSLNNIMNADLSFYGPNRSELLSTYVGDMFNADTLIHGHTPAARLIGDFEKNMDLLLKEQLRTLQYAGNYTDPESGVSLVNIDANYSSGMRLTSFKLPMENGITQVPTDMILNSAFNVPQELIPTIPVLTNTKPPISPQSLYLLVAPTTQFGQ